MVQPPGNENEVGSHTLEFFQDQLTSQDRFHGVPGHTGMARPQNRQAGDIPFFRGKGNTKGTPGRHAFFVGWEVIETNPEADNGSFCRYWAGGLARWAAPSWAANPGSPRCPQYPGLPGTPGLADWRRNNMGFLARASLGVSRCA